MQPILRGQIWTVTNAHQEFEVLIISNNKFNRSQRYDYYQAIPLYPPTHSTTNTDGVNIYGKIAMVELISTIREYELVGRKKSASPFHLQQVEKELIEQLGIGVAV